jgi:hypothetical protein
VACHLFPQVILTCVIHTCSHVPISTSWLHTLLWTLLFTVSSEGLESLFCFFFLFFETGSHYVTQVGLELTILLPA